MKHLLLSQTWRDSQVPNGHIQFGAMAITLKAGARKYHNWKAHAARVVAILIRRQSA